MLAQWERRFEEKLIQNGLAEGVSDPAHDIAHFKRVVTAAKALCLEEKAKPEVVVPAAWLHDFVNVPKNDPRRSQASRISAAAAIEYLASEGYPAEFHAEIAHAIEAHSFSAKIEPRTLEARIVQDADRLDGLGAIGIARCFAVAGMLQRRIYDPEDPFGTGERPMDDLVNTIDHFYVKLFKVAEVLTTSAGRLEGKRRAEYMRLFLKELGREIGAPTP
ncbi:MAG: HD domain-containing protein [Methylotenera sp.]|nr:HD domain-containing protein [Oligoflexia bacterium]